MTSLQVTSFGLDDLVPYYKNPRRGNIQEIAKSLEKHGQYRAIAVNKGTHTGRPNEILAGNHTYFAAQALGWATIDATVIDVDDATATSIVLADNRLADLGDYDEQALADLLEAIDDLDGTGYSDEDLAAFIDIDEPVQLTDPDAVPEPPQAPRLESGDIVDLGNSRLYVGDSTDTDSVVKALTTMRGGAKRADCVWTDPPYGVNYVGKTKDALTIDNDGKDGLEELLNGAFATIIAVARGGAPVYVAHADTERMTFEKAMIDSGITVRQNLVWVKNTLVLGHADYHYKHEPILYGFTSNGEGTLGRGGEHWYGDNAQTTVLEFDKPSRNGIHPTMKPVELIQSMLANSCPPHGLVADIFGGSGSTLIAAHDLGMRAFLVELDPHYADVICRRFEEHTGIVPIVNGEQTSFVTAEEELHE